MKIGVKVMPREVILDTQGRAIEQTLRMQNIKLEGARVGRFIELSLLESSEQEALGKAKQIAESLLCNPLIETYELSVMKG